MTIVRTRFAPSPTGYLHVGGARTALFSWLHARKQGGTFILRIEDTDLERSTEASVNAILDGMSWLGLGYDEGPYFQTKRFDRYEQVILQLMDRGLAYRCHCSRQRLETLREKQMARKEKPRYDGHCQGKNIDPDKDHVIRFRNPTEGSVVVEDLVRGRVAFQNSELDDLIIRRSNGSPTYNLTVVVDDLDMEITQVIRGDDHLNNTPRQINILRALGHEPPKYAHVPMILGDDGMRLSKRHGAVSVMQYRDEGYLPEAMCNYLIRLGWSHGDQEIFSIQEMIDFFDICDVNKAASAFNTEKLQWLNQHYIKETSSEKMTQLLQSQMDKLGIDTQSGPDLTKVVEVQRERAKTLVEMAEISSFFYKDYTEFDAAAAKKHLRPVALEALKHIKQALSELTDWTESTLHDAVVKVAEMLDVKLGKVAQPLRVAIVGRAASPGIDITLKLVGQEAALRRIDRAIEYVQQRAQNNY